MKNTAHLPDATESEVDGIVIADSNGIIQSANPSACGLFDYEEDSIVGLNMDSLFAYGVWKEIEKNVFLKGPVAKSHVIENGRVVTCVKSNREIFELRLELSIIRYGSNLIYAAILHDLSAEKRTGEQLKQCAEHLETVVNDRVGFLKSFIKTLEQAKSEIHSSLEQEHKSNHLKSEFVAIASHEFRMPLTSIQLSASLIEHYYDRLSREKIFTHLKKIKTSVNYLTTILNDFLSVDKIEHGKFKADLREFDLKALIEGVLAEMKLQAKTGQVFVYTHRSEKVLAKLDHSLVIHCLLNLISNAIKYAPENSQIEIVSKIGDLDCIISVRDHGIGIPEEARGHLFEPFFRAGNAGDITGTGLGLTIVKRYMDLIGGQVTYLPNETGSTFSLIFPDFVTAKN